MPPFQIVLITRFINQIGASFRNQVSTTVDKRLVVDRGAQDAITHDDTSVHSSAIEGQRISAVLVYGNDSARASNGRQQVNDDTTSSLIQTLSCVA